MSNEIKGVGNSYTAEFWEYDPRVGRRWNLDPKPNISLSPYAVFENNPIWKNDLLGDTTRPGSGSSTRDNPTVVGTLAHTTLAQYLESVNIIGLNRQWETGVILFSGKKPDIVNRIDNTVWELKPESWSAEKSYSKYIKAKYQLNEYVAELNLNGSRIPGDIYGSFTAGGTPQQQPIINGTILPSSDRTYQFRYYTVNSNSGTIFYEATKLSPHRVPQSIPSPKSNPFPPPIPISPIGFPIPKSGPRLRPLAPAASPVFPLLMAPWIEGLEQLIIPLNENKRDGGSSMM